MTPELFDSHTHLDIGPLGSDVAGVLDRARAAGVTQVLAVGCAREVGSVGRVVALARAHRGVVASVGVHPHDARFASPELLAEVEAQAASPEVVAVGEMGLDYHYMRSGADDQREAFRRQLRIASRVGKPAILHLREATTDALAILGEEGLPAAGGIVHCYSEGPAELEAFLSLGLYVAFSGIVTFPRASDVQEAARLAPADRILVETDAPYLAPIPHRGKTNEAAFLPHTAAHLARLRETSLPELARQTFSNALRVFGLQSAGSP